MALTPRNVTAPGRLSYAHLDTPHQPNPQAEPQYSAVLLIPKTDTVTVAAVQAAIQAAVQAAVERGIFSQPIDPAHTKYPPLRDGDAPNENGEPRGEAYAGHWFISAKNKRQPIVVDAQRQPVINPDEVYSGCYVNMAIEFFGYSNSGNKGIAASLIGVQKTRDGERFGTAPLEATDVFGVVDTGGPVNTASLGF